MEPLVIITGPTASGKTAFAFSVMDRLAAQGVRPELINADSVQIYQGFDIGSAKPSAEELRRYPSHLFSECRPGDDTDVVWFQRRADAVVRDIRGRGGLPVLVGGTGLYIQTLLHGIVTQPDVGEAAQIRFQQYLDRLCLESSCGQDQVAMRNCYYNALVERDPYTAELLSPSDTVRVRRALQVNYLSGQSLRRLQEEHSHRELRYRALVLNLCPEREALYRSIDVRAGKMLHDGLLEEVRQIVDREGAAVRPLTSLGYRHALQVLREEVSLERGSFLLMRDTRRYAKRQLTWWRNQPVKLGWELLSGCPTFSKNGQDPGQFQSLVVGWACDNIALLVSRETPFRSDRVYFAPLELRGPWCR